MTFSIDTKKLKTYVSLLYSVSGKIGAVTISISSSTLGQKICFKTVAEGRELFLVEDVDSSEPFPQMTVSGFALHKMFKDKKIKTETVEFTMDHDSDVVVIKSGRARFKLETMNQRLMSSLDRNCAASLLVSVADFESLISKVQYAVGSDETEPEFMGVYLHTNNGRLVAVATNKHRIARYTIPFHGSNVDDGVIIPNRVLASINKLLDMNEGESALTLLLSNGIAAIETELGSLQFTLVDKPYIDYKAVLKTPVSQIDVGSHELREAIGRLLIVAGEAMKIEVMADDGELVLTADGVTELGHYKGSGEERVAYDGDVNFKKVAVNGNYLSEAMTCEARIDFGQGNAPIYIQGLLDKEYIAAVMPIRS